jgi:microcystin-dependent protein
MKTNSVSQYTLRLAAVCLLSLTAGLPALRAADANPPDKMSYQSYLVDANGVPLGNTNTGPKNYDVIFRIWNDQVSNLATNRLWAEQQTVTVDNGYFSILLGNGNAYGSEARPPLSSLFGSAADTSDRYVEMTVKGIGPGGADSTILPRVRLLPAPYAFLAKNAVSAYSLANPANSQVMSVVGTSVGINKLVPASALDVQGTVTASTGFVGPGTIPVGGIIMWSGTTVPTGWALCDGQGGRPDLRGRFILGSGAGSGLTARSMGQTGGEENQTLQWNQMPRHSHYVDPPGVDTANSGNHSHGFSDAYYAEFLSGGANNIRGSHGGEDNDNSYFWRGGTTDWAGEHRHWVDIPGFRTDDQGNNAAHNNMPPYYVLAFIMRVQ